jgi:hypothetical protein
MTDKYAVIGNSIAHSKTSRSHWMVYAQPGRTRSLGSEYCAARAGRGIPGRQCRQLRADQRHRKSAGFKLMQRDALLPGASTVFE